MWDLMMKLQSLKLDVKEGKPALKCLYSHVKHMLLRARCINYEKYLMF